jgi:hypothetical protein
MDWKIFLLDIVKNPATWGLIAFLIWMLWASKTKYAAIIRDAAFHAYQIVEGMQIRGTLPAYFSKEAAAVTKFKELMEQQNYKVSDAAIDLAKLLWASYAAQSKQVAAVTKVDPAAKSSDPLLPKP